MPKWFSAKYPDNLHIFQVDNGRLHTWSSVLRNSIPELALDRLPRSELEIPENIILLFQPAYCPQVNPIERLWKEIKKLLKWELFDHLDELRNKLAQVLSHLTPSVVASVTGWDFILEALFVAGI